ncbi:peptide deformylase, partial [Salinivirga cyanobacteriivorans]
MSKDSSQAMRVWTIANNKDSVLLRQKSEPVIPDSTNEVLQTLVHRLYKTVTDSMSLGVGISAPQVGILKQVIWVQRFDKDGFPFEFYLNPQIKQYSKLTQECREGCLSIPGRMDTLNSRSYAILLEYQSMDGQKHVEMVEDFTAVIFQHEIDHLNGILYTDHL